MQELSELQAESKNIAGKTTDKTRTFFILPPERSLL